MVIGVGNPWRRDDAAGLAVAGRLRGRLAGTEVRECEGEPAGLIDAWEGAVSSGAPPGTVHRIDAGGRALPADLFRASTHHLGLADAVELARALGRLPARVVFYGIEGESFDAGQGLTTDVAGAVECVAQTVQEEVERCTSGS